MSKKDRYPLILLFLWGALWIFTAIAPRYRDVWIAENTQKGNRPPPVKCTEAKLLAHQKPWVSQWTGGMLASLGAISFGVPVLSPEDR